MLIHSRIIGRNGGRQIAQTSKEANRKENINIRVKLLTSEVKSFVWNAQVKQCQQYWDSATKGCTQSKVLMSCWKRERESRHVQSQWSGTCWGHVTTTGPIKTTEELTGWVAPEGGSSATLTAIQHQGRRRGRKCCSAAARCSQQSEQ